jgi:hypothetical protein
LNGGGVLGVLQHGKSDEVIDKSGYSFLVWECFLIFFDESIGFRGSALESIGEDDLLFGGWGNVGGAVACDLAEYDAGFVVSAGLEEGLAELEESLAGQIGPIFNILDFLLSFLHASEFFWGGGGLAGDFSSKRGEFCLELGYKFVATRDGAEAGDGLGEATGGQIEVGELKIGFDNEGGVGTVCDAGVDLASVGEGGFSIRFFEIGEELAGAFGFRVALEVVDIFGELFFLIGFSGSV